MVAIAACGSSTSSASSGTSPAASAPASSGGSAATAGKFLGCMVTDTGGINDRSFNASAWQGMQEAASANTSVTVKYLQSTTQSDYVPNINTFISQKCGIVVTVGFLMAQATQNAAKAHPTQDFAIVDPPSGVRCCTRLRRECVVARDVPVAVNRDVITMPHFDEHVYRSWVTMRCPRWKEALRPVLLPAGMGARWLLQRACTWLSVRSAAR